MSLLSRANGMFWLMRISWMWPMMTCRTRAAYLTSARHSAGLCHPVRMSASLQGNRIHENAFIFLEYFLTVSQSKNPRVDQIHSKMQSNFKLSKFFQDWIIEFLIHLLFTYLFMCLPYVIGCLNFIYWLVMHSLCLMKKIK